MGQVQQVFVPLLVDPSALVLCQRMSAVCLWVMVHLLLEHHQLRCPAGPVS